MTLKLPKAPGTWPPEEQKYHDKWIAMIQQAIETFGKPPEEWTTEVRNKYEDEWAKIVAIVRALAAQWAGTYPVPQDSASGFRDKGNWNADAEDYEDSWAFDEHAQLTSQFPVGLPLEAARILQKWKPIFSHSRAYFNKPGSLAYPEEGTQSVSNRWNFTVGETFIVAACTDTPVPKGYWAHAVYGGRLWNVTKIWPPDVKALAERDLEVLLRGGHMKNGVELDELMDELFKIYWRERER